MNKAMQKEQYNNDAWPPINIAANFEFSFKLYTYNNETQQLEQYKYGSGF